MEFRKDLSEDVPFSLAADEIGFAYPKMRTVEMLREEAKDRSAWVILDTTGEGLA